MKTNNKRCTISSGKASGMMHEHILYVSPMRQSSFGQVHKTIEESLKRLKSCTQNQQPKIFVVDQKAIFCWKDVHSNREWHPTNDKACQVQQTLKGDSSGSLKSALWAGFSCLLVTSTLAHCLTEAPLVSLGVNSLNSPKYCKVNNCNEPNTQPKWNKVEDIAPHHYSFLAFFHRQSICCALGYIRSNPTPEWLVVVTLEKYKRH